MPCVHVLTTHALCAVACVRDRAPPSEVEVASAAPGDGEEIDGEEIESSTVSAVEVVETTLEAPLHSTSA